MSSIQRTLLLALLGLLLTAGCGLGRKSDAERLNAMIGRATQADVIQQAGPPQQSMRVDGDDFLFYSVGVSNPIAGIGSVLSGWSAGYQGQPYTPPPQQTQTYILRFDGVTGKLKGWGVR